MSEGIIIKSDPNQTLAQIQAEIAAFEANPVDPGAPDVSTAPTVTAPATATPPEKAALPTTVTPQTTEPAKPTQQPQETAVQAPTGAEPVKETDWKEAYKGLQKKFNEKFMEKKSAEKTAVQSSFDEFPNELTPELIKQLDADSEKNPWVAVDKLIRARLSQNLTPVKSELDEISFERKQTATLTGLDRLAQKHEWLKTPEGIARMEQVLSENPELWKNKDPYRSALGYIDIPSKTQQPSQAQTTGLTPMLGAGGVVPTAVSTPAVSKVEKLATLNEQAELFMSRGQIAKAKEILAQMDEIDRGY